MKILFVTHYTQMYGANMAMCNLIEAYKKLGIECAVLTPNKGAITDVLDDMKIEYCIGNYGRCDVLIDRSILYKAYKYTYALIMNRKAHKTVSQFMQNHKFDIIHTNSLCVSFGAELADKYNIPHIWHIREYMEEDYNIRVVMTPHIKKLYKKTASFIAISKAIQEKYSDRIPIEKMALIYDGVEYIQRNTEDKKTNKFIFTIVGMISENKGTLDAIEAYGKMVDRTNCKDTELWIVGGGRENKALPLNEKIDIAINKYDIKDSVKFLGMRKDVQEILAKADCGLMCSKKEAFGRVTVEYMQNRLIVIGGNTGGTPEIIDDGRTGFLYEQGNSDSLAQKMQYVYENKHHLQDMADAAYEKATGFYLIERCAGEIVDLYKKVLENRNGK